MCFNLATCICDETLNYEDQNNYFKPRLKHRIILKLKEIREEGGDNFLPQKPRPILQVVLLMPGGKGRWISAGCPADAGQFFKFHSSSGFPPGG